MNQKITSQQLFLLLFGLLLVGAIVILTLNFNNPPTLQIAPELSGSQPNAANAEAFDYERAADISAVRWQAMGRYYEAHGLLTRDNFDYEQAAENMAYRWNAMGRAYETAGLLNDRMDPGDVMAFRWQAMAEAYKRMGLLNDK